MQYLAYMLVWLHDLQLKQLENQTKICLKNPLCDSVYCCVQHFNCSWKIYVSGVIYVFKNS